MLWEEVLDCSQYEATHYDYSEICGDSSSTKNYNNAVNEYSLSFVDFRKVVGRNSIKKDSIIHFQSMLIPTNIILKNANKEYKDKMWIQNVIDYYKNNYFFFFENFIKRRTRCAGLDD